MSDSFLIQQIGSYRLGSIEELSSKQCSELIAAFETKVGGARAVLGGRNSGVRCNIDRLGRVVVKHYRRGGWFGSFVSRYYMRFGASRSEHEFRLLNRARRLGVNAPCPVAFATEGSFIYRAWLATQEIEQELNLAELSLADEERALSYLDELSVQISRLIEGGIFHLDLHPGNVLLSATGELFVVDFDKAELHRGKRRELRDKYLRRWRRAVIKHRLPESLNEVMSMKLRRTVGES